MKLLGSVLSSAAFLAGAVVWIDATTHDETVSSVQFIIDGPSSSFSLFLIENQSARAFA
jgi:hypothetical protein